MKISSRNGFGLGVLLVSQAALHAEWRTDGGYYKLAAELGAALPTGQSIEMFQCEADEDRTDGAPYVYLPQASSVTPFNGTGQFTGKTFHALGGTGAGSGHAAAVCNTLCAADSISEGVTSLFNHEALQFYNAVRSGTAPPSFGGTVQNHSWIGFPDALYPAEQMRDMVRRYDFMLDRDGILGVVALNNGIGAVPYLMAPSYNAICAGLRNGNHSTSGTLSDQDGPGRMKPDLVVDQQFTSLAAPSIASAAALLYDAIRPGFPDADRPQAVKAILLAGASKAKLPGWHRQSAARPYDEVLGAGELNILNAYHVLAKGRQPHSASLEVAPLGWDADVVSSTAARRYFFTVPVGRMADTFSVTLTWHRVISTSGSPSEPTYETSLPDLNLKLYASTAFAPGATPIDQSISTVDNVEHLWLRNLPPGQYMLEVSSDTTDHIYALAWEAQIGSGPRLSARRTGSTQVAIDFSVIDPFVTYTVESATTLGPSADWTTATTFRTADSSAALTFTWTDTTATGAAKFYRLKWTAVR